MHPEYVVRLKSGAVLFLWVTAGTKSSNIVESPEANDVDRDAAPTSKAAKGSRETIPGALERRRDAGFVLSIR